LSRKSAHKQRTRRRILDEAAKAMREHGHEGISVAKPDETRRLTHGGFYAHFKDRDDLVAEAISRMFEDSNAMVARHLRPNQPREALVALIDDYLSDDHRRRAATGCPIAALGSEAARLPTAARRRFEEGLGTFRKSLRNAIAETGVENPDSVASFALSEMVGALALARAMSNETEANELLNHVREQLKCRLGLVRKELKSG